MIKQFNASAIGEGSGVLTDPARYRRKFEEECRDDLSLIVHGKVRDSDQNPTNARGKNTGRNDRHGVVLSGTVVGFATAFSAYLRNADFSTIILVYLIAFLAGYLVFAAMLRFISGPVLHNYSAEE